MSFGTFNAVGYNRFAWNARWSAALEFPLTANSSHTAGAHTLAGAGTNAIAGASAHTTGAHTLASAGTNAIVATGALLQGDFLISATAGPRFVRHRATTLLNKHTHGATLNRHAPGASLVAHQ